LWFIRGSWDTRTDPVKLSGAHAQPSEVFETRAGACGPNNLGGSATAGIGARLSLYGHIRIFKTKFWFWKTYFQLNTLLFGLKNGFKKTIMLATSSVKP
jgi:hypothetical protein